MIRRAAILLGVPVLLAVAFAIPLGLWRGEYQWLCAGVDWQRLSMRIEGLGKRV